MIVLLYLKVGLLITIFMCLMLLHKGESQCTNDHPFCTEYNNNKVLSAYCILYKNPEKSTCDKSLYEDYYTYPGNCEPNNCKPKVINHCEGKSVCKNNGVCLSLIGLYTCHCPANYHGADCSLQTAVGRKHTRGIYIVVKPLGFDIRNRLIIFVNQYSDDMIISFSTTSSGESVKLNNKHLKESNNGTDTCISIFEKSSCTIIPSGKMYYLTLFYDIPYKADGPDVTMTYNSNLNSGKGRLIPGYKKYKLEVTVKDGDSLEFSKTLTQSIEYGQLKCPSQVVLKNCGESSNKPLQIERSAKTVIRSVIEDNPDCENPIKEFTWAIFKHEDIFIESPSPISESSGSDSEYIIDKYEQAVGLYKVKLVVSAQGRFQGGSYNATYIGVCFIEVVRRPLSIVISGGATRSIAFGDPIIMDATQSQDPDQPPGQQNHLRWTWKCDLGNNGIPLCQSNTLMNGLWKVPKQIKDSLRKGQEVKFELTLSTSDDSSPPVTAHQSITISELPQAELQLSCLKNCGTTKFKTNPKEVVYLAVRVINSYVIKEFQWLYSVDDDNEMSTDEIKQATDNSSVLIIKQNTLHFGKTYMFIVKAVNCFSEITKGSCEGRSTIEIEVNKPPATGTCSVTPPSGDQVVTKFEINCIGFSTDRYITQLRYEFYQSSDKSTLGTLLGFSIVGELKNVILSESFLTVRVFDVDGMYTDFTAIVELRVWDPSDEDIKTMMSNLTSLISSGDRAGSIRMAGAVIDVMENVSDKAALVYDVLQLLSKEHMNDFSDVKLYSSTMKKLASKSVVLLESGLNSQGVKAMGHLMNSLAERLFYEIQTNDMKESVITADEISEIALMMLECTDLIVASKDMSLFSESTGALAMFSLHDQYKRGTENMVNALAYTGMAVMSNMLPQEKETVITTNDTVMWLKVERPSALSNLSGIPFISTTKLKLSDQLGVELQKSSAIIALEVATMKNNPYWWDIQDRDVASDIVSLRIWDWNPEKLKKINIIPSPVDIYLSVKNTKAQTLSGSVTQPDMMDSDDMKDASIVVHTIEGPHENSNGKLFAEFTDLSDKEFLVIISSNMRPYYALMKNEAQTISQESSSVSLMYQNVTESALFFIGILPGRNILPGKTLHYTMNIYSVQCKVRQKTVWTSPACLVGEGTSKDVVHCRCSHLSFFGSSIFVAPNAIHPIKDARLFLTLEDNPYVFIFIIILLTIYVLVLLWTLIQGTKDRLKRKVVVLEDNFPGEPFPYLIVVYTAFNIGASTRANVGITLIGEKSSRAHILSSKERKVFTVNADDWFLIFTPEHLGSLNSIHLWHDNSGSNPDWCCRNVKVYDLTTRADYTFEVRQWLSVWPHEYTEVLAPVAQPGEVFQWHKVLVQNILYNLQEKHIWLSIFISHPRATMSKSQRLTLVYVLIMMSFLTGLMFYGLAKGKNVQDESEFAIKTRMIIIAIESTIISVTVTSLVMLCFKKSQMIVPSEPSVRENSSLQRSSTADDTIKLTKLIKLRTNKKQVLKIILSRLIKTIVRGKPLIPVLVGKESSASVIRRKRFAKAGWIISQIIIWGSAYLIILYGLKLGKIISILWVTTSAFGFFYGIFISMPLRIFILSTILFICGEMCDVATFECEIENAMKRDHFGDEDYLKKLIELRSLPIYRPMCSQRRKQLQAIALDRNTLFQHLEFIATILFFLALLNVTGDLWRIQNYYVNSHITSTLTRSWRASSVSLQDAQNATRLADYLISTLIPAIYKEKWYNGAKLTSKDESLEEMGWLVDTAHRLVGVPQMRQIRIVADNCSFSKMFNNSRARCLPALSERTEDTKNYGIDWGPISKYINKPLLASWTYQQTLRDSSPMCGESGVQYHSGGYIATLAPTQEGCNAVISDLIDNGWWDIRMRASIIELTVYNPNTDSYSVVTVISEHLASGAFTGRLQVITIHISFRILSLITFVCILITFNIRLVKTINRSGVVHVFTNFWCLYDVALVAVTNISTIFETIKVIRASTLVHVFQQKADSDFFYFSQIIFYKRVSVMLWSFVLCLAPIRLLKFKPFVINFRAVYYTIYEIRKLLAITSAIGFIIIYFQLFVINFAFCPKKRATDVTTKFYNTEHYDSYACEVFASLSLAVVFGVIIAITQTLLWKGYKAIKGKVILDTQSS